MADFDAFAVLPSSLLTTGIFDSYQDLSLAFEAELAGVIAVGDWDMSETPGSAVTQLAGGLISTDYGRYQNHPLVDLCLTRGLQIRWLQPLNTRPNQISTTKHTTSRYTPTYT